MLRRDPPLARFLSIACALALAPVALAACGGATSGEKDASPAADASPDASLDAEPSDGPVESGPACRVDADCPALPLPCQLCPDGTCQSQWEACVDGACTLASAPCPAVDGGAACVPMDAAGVGACDAWFGWSWDGHACVGLGGCSCAGSDCGHLYAQEADCRAAHAGCP